jgi:hypothetical protein
LREKDYTMMARRFAAFLTAIAVAIAATFACDNVPQPKPGCGIGQGNFAAKYIAKPGQTLTGACAAKKGEIIGVRDYGVRGVDYSIAIQTATLGSVSGRDGGSPDNVLFSFGRYADDPGPDDFCVAASLSPAVQRYPPQSLPDGGTLPAIDRRYEWSNARFLVTPLFAGTQMTAEMRYVDVDCNGNYEVIGLWPAVGCAKMVDGGRVPDDTRCATQVDPDAGIKIGCVGGPGTACLSPDTLAKCDPDTFLCVLDGRPPVVRQ